MNPENYKTYKLAGGPFDGWVFRIDENLEPVEVWVWNVARYNASMLPRIFLWDNKTYSYDLRTAKKTKAYIAEHGHKPEGYMEATIYYHRLPTGARSLTQHIDKYISPPSPIPLDKDL